MDNRQFPRAEIKWPVFYESNGHSTEGVTLNMSPSGLFIRCANPLKLNEVFDLTIKVPESDRNLRASVEVVWSNIYGPDDHITPRGMGVRFLEISSEDRQVIAKQVMEHLQEEEKNIDSDRLQSLQTLMIDQDEIG